ncbi:MAG: adenine deaminase [Nitrospirae bacterium]|nr:adenine deaminase [Nitrospirota bacterium]
MTDNPVTPGRLARLIEVARGLAPADLLIAGGKLVNVASGEVYPANVAICGDQIAAIGPEYTEAREVIDATGQFVLPGLIDAHMHIESSMLTPPEFARAVVPHGTTAIIIDPHEIANVLGLAGVRYILDASRDLPLDLYVMASSCVPATDMETAGAAFGSGEIGELLGWERVIGLAEMMNVPAVLGGAQDTLAMLAAAHRRGVPIDGHAPGLTGKDIVAYAAAGVRSDHECTTAAEALEKLRLGMYLMIREGSAAKNMEDLLPVVTDANYRRCLLVSDDTHPADLVARGHVDHSLRKAVRLGLDPVRAVQMVTINAAHAFGLKNRGAVLPGYQADVVCVADLADFAVQTVVKGGRPVVRDGALCTRIESIADPSVYKSIRTGSVTEASFAIPFTAEKAHVIGLTGSQLVTRKLVEPVTIRDGHAVADVARDILKLAVVERHTASGNIGLGLVKGLGLKKGAIASSVSHDSHNVIVVGTNDRDMVGCVDALRDMGGGFVVVVDGQVVAALPLPVAGLMSDRPLEEVCAKGMRLREVARELGVPHPAPFITLSFLALPVIPELKLTDHGLVDVIRFRLIDLAA